MEMELPFRVQAIRMQTAAILSLFGNFVRKTHLPRTNQYGNGGLLNPYGLLVCGSYIIRRLLVLQRLGASALTQNAGLYFQNLFLLYDLFTKLKHPCCT